MPRSHIAPGNGLLRQALRYSRPAQTTDGWVPDYDMMVEVWFDSLEDLYSYIRSDGFLQTVDPDHANFIDLSSIVRLVTDERVLIGQRAFGGAVGTCRTLELSMACGLA